MGQNLGRFFRYGVAIAIAQNEEVCTHLGMPVQEEYSTPSLRLETHGVLPCNVICMSVSTENNLSAQLQSPRRATYEGQRNSAQSVASARCCDCNCALNELGACTKRDRFRAVEPFNPTALRVALSSGDSSVGAEGCCA